MDIVEWVPALEIGVQVIDAQHRHLVEMLNQLGRAIDERHGRETIMSVIEEMRKYAHYHFQTEEIAMDETHYPKCSLHKLEHDQFINKIIDVTGEMESGGSVTPDEVCEFLHEWITTHIQETDKALGAYLVQQNVNWGSRG